MDENEKPSKESADTPTPEVDQLLRILEAQRAARRVGKGLPPTPAGFQGETWGTFRWGSIAVIIVFALGSVGLMEWMVSQLPKPTAGPVMAPATGAATPSKK